MRFPVGPQCDERQVVAVGKTGGKGIGPTGPTRDEGFDIGHAERAEQTLLQPCVVVEGT